MLTGGGFKLDGQLEVAAARHTLEPLACRSTASTLRAAALRRTGATACGVAARRRGLGDGSRARTRTSETGARRGAGRAGGAQFGAGRGERLAAPLAALGAIAYGQLECVSRPVGAESPHGGCAEWLCACLLRAMALRNRSTGILGYRWTMPKQRT